MSEAWKVVVEGGGKNLYKVSETDDTYYVYRVSVHIPFDDNELIGKTDSLELALVLIKEDSGEDIEKLTEW